MVLGEFLVFSDIDELKSLAAIHLRFDVRGSAFANVALRLLDQFQKTGVVRHLVPLAVKRL